jgi:hypothetical protein
MMGHDYGDDIKEDPSLATNKPSMALPPLNKAWVSAWLDVVAMPPDHPAIQAMLGP